MRPHPCATRDHASEEQIEAAEIDAEIAKMPDQAVHGSAHQPARNSSRRSKRKEDDELEKMTSFPEEPVARRAAGSCIEHAALPRWQQEILEIIRDEAYYFAPQGQTKIMNEGWATYWHTTHDDRGHPHRRRDHRLRRPPLGHGRSSSPAGSTRTRWAWSCTGTSKQRWNKGRFGKEWMDCDDPAVRARWDTGAGLGREKIFEVRRTHNDITFLDTFLTADFCREQGFFTTKFDPKANEWVIDSREFDDVKRQLLQMLASRGTPRVYVVDGNHDNRGELRLMHEHEGLDIQLDWARVTLGNLAGDLGAPRASRHRGSRTSRSGSPTTAPT